MRPIVIMLAVIIVLSGCVSPPTSAGGDGQPEATSLPAGIPLGLDLMLEGGVPWQVSALVWPAANATTAIILVHGHSGVKENYYSTLPTRGASFGARLALTNRTVVAIDLPGYGRSDGDPNAVDFEVMADAVRQTATALRDGTHGFAAHPKVVAYGLSMGAVIVNMAASGHDQLDAIIPAGYTVSPPTQKGMACLADPAGCPEAGTLYNGEFYKPNIDWAVANATIAGYETGQHEANQVGYTLWDGACSATELTGQPVPCGSRGGAEAVASRVAVPVFTLIGDHDLPYLGTDLSGEAAHYPSSPGVETWVVPDAGHFIHNHLHQPVVVQHISAWLAGHGL